MIYGIPNFLYEKIKSQYDEDVVNKIIEGYRAKRKTTFRVNTLKTNKEEIEQILNEKNIVYQKVNWYEDAFILQDASEEDIKRLSIFEEGKIYLQSLSSMIPVLFLQPQEKENILDMCAAPGSKTTQISAISYNTSLITACEKNKIRAEKLKYNIAKQGAQKITVLTQDSRNLSEYFSFDKILLDSPCSGSGTISIQNEKLEEVFTEELVKRSVKTQYALLKKAVSLLKPNHEMIYSTCSILKEENEENIVKLVESQEVELVPIQLAPRDELPLLPTRLEETITVCPTAYYEGFFIAKLRKKNK